MIALENVLKPPSQAGLMTHLPRKLWTTITEETREDFFKFVLLPDQMFHIFVA